MQNIFKHSVLLVVLCFCNGSRVLETHGVQTILAVQNEDVVISCEDNVPMSYCGFVHPNGTKIPFTGAGLDIGRCSITLKVSPSDAGLWSCHMGHQHAPGNETSKMINVRVVNKLTAVESNVTVLQCMDVTLRCTTSQRMSPLRYCRFVPPHGKPFGIDARITKDNPIQGKYFFPEHASLDRGDCAVSISRTTQEERGRWLCEAWLEEDSREFQDFIYLDVQDYPSLSPGITAGLSFAFTLLLAATILVSILLCKRRKSNLYGQKKNLQLLRESEILPREYIDIPQITIQVVKSNSSGFLEDMYNIE